MEIDSGASKSRDSKRRKAGPVLGKSGIQKRKAKKASIVFPSRKRKQAPGKKSSA